MHQRLNRIQSGCLRAILSFPSSKSSLCACLIVSAGCLAAAILVGFQVAAQSPGTPLNPAGQGHSASHFPSDSPPLSPNQTLDQKRISLLNKLRQRSMVDDATKLLFLARQLNADPSNMSDAERMHKAAEIEKLAKSVKEKMSYAVGDNPVAPNFTTAIP
jgi:hypothetical protein